MTTNNAEKKIWNLTNIIASALGALILLLLTAGFWSINNKIEMGDTIINQRLGDLCTQINKVNEGFIRIEKEIARIDTLQKIRLDKEKMMQEHELKKGRN